VESISGHDRLSMIDGLTMCVRQLRYHGFYAAAGMVSKESQVVPDPVEPSNELSRLVYLGSLVSEGRIG
jgi:hypothetical protein